MERRTCSPLMATILLALVCLSVWQIIGCPGPPKFYVTNPVYTLLSPSNATSDLSYLAESLPPWDFTTLINMDNFKFEIMNPICNDSSPFLLVLVHSAPGNKEKRRTIRETWGEPRESMKLVFLLGKVDSKDQQKSLVEENRIYGDIIQGNFKDAYRNMTYKHVMAFKFAIYYCPQVKYILKTDDDIFVNMPVLMTFLNTELSPWGSRKLMLCSPFRNAVVKRSYRSKWRVSYKEYPDKYYPTYCPGWAIIYSPDVAFRLYREAQRSNYFWIDDVHITGVLAKRIDVVHTPVKNLVLTYKQVKDILRTNSTENSPEIFLYGAPEMNQSEIHRLWLVVKESLKHHRVVRAR